jgi:hypothetical protein
MGPVSFLLQVNRKSVFSILLGCIVVAGFSALSWSQASVNESLETATIYVDANKGSDNNNGSQGAPFKTIGAAANLALANNYSRIGSRVIINAGTYRESVTIAGGSSRSTSLPITFQAATNGTVFISGADILTGWTSYSGNSKIFETSWPYKFGVCPALGSRAPFEQEIVRHAEMIVVNGTPLTQVLSLSAMLPGTFFVDEPHAIVYVYPAAGTNMSAATVETATRPHLLADHGQSQVVFRGLTFQYANTCHGDAALLLDAKANNLLFDNDNIVWNNAMGISFSTTEHFTVQNSTASHNGELGFHSHRVKYDLWQSDTATYNNWRGAQGAFYTWDTGGSKWMLDHSGTYNNITALFNQANGVAWDTDQENVTLTNLISASNLGNGYLIEKSEGPFAISNSNLCYNNPLGSTQRAGLVVRNTEKMTITGTTLYGNGANQLAVVGEVGGIAVNNWETGAYYLTVTKDLTSAGNKLHGSQSNVFSDYLGGTDWTTFVNSLNSNTNTYYAGSNASAFAVPDRRFGTTKIDLSSWKSTTGQDASSTWASASAPAACAVAAKSPDFWLASSSYDGVSLDPAGHASFNVAVFALGGLTGNVVLSSAGLSSVPGLTGSFSPASISTSSTSGSSVLTVAATPLTKPGTYPVTILGNLGNVTRAMTLSLVVPKTTVRLSAANLTFAGQKVNTTSAPQLITLTNTGSTALAIAGISMTGNFAQTNTCGLTVKAGGNCTISVTFTPRVVTQTSGSLTINDSDLTISQSVSLGGTGIGAPKISFLPTSVNFGAHPVGAKSGRVMTLKNAGTVTLSISKMAISGTKSADFKFTTTCGSSLAVGASCGVTITFTPGAKGTQSGTWSINDNDGYRSSPQAVSLTGTGR